MGRQKQQAGEQTLHVAAESERRLRLCYASNMRLSKGSAAWWSWSNAGWLFRSRGYGSIFRSRTLVAGRIAMRKLRTGSRHRAATATV
jgi:hypothetical protein